MAQHADELDLTLVRTYINDHITGASAVSQRVERMSRNPDTGDDAPALARLARELEKERRVHEATARDLGFTLSRWKHLGAAVAERVARLKPNGRLVRRSPLSLVLELEILRSGLEGKRLGWTTLREHADALGLDPARLDALVERSRAQADLVEDISARHRGSAFEPRGARSRTAPGPRPSLGAGGGDGRAAGVDGTGRAGARGGPGPGGSHAGRRARHGA